MRAGPVLLAAGLAAACGRAPVLEEYSYARGFAGEARLHAEVEYAAGRLRISPSRSGALFEMSLQYDAERFRPIGNLTPEGTVRLGAESLREGGVRLGRGSRPQIAEIGFAPQPALDLRVVIGAAEADLDLGGLRLERLRLTTGASRSQVRFLQPNPGDCALVEASSGAGELRIERAGNSSCAEWRFDGGIGKITLDLAGAWRGDPRFDLNLAVGGAVLLVPREMGVRVTMEGLVAKFDGQGFQQSDRTWTSEGFDQAMRKAEVAVRSAVGGLRVEWK